MDVPKHCAINIQFFFWRLWKRDMKRLLRRRHKWRCGYQPHAMNTPTHVQTFMPKTLCCCSCKFIQQICAAAVNTTHSSLPWCREAAIGSPTVIQSQQTKMNSGKRMNEKTNGWQEIETGVAQHQKKRPVNVCNVEQPQGRVWEKGTSIHWTEEPDEEQQSARVVFCFSKLHGLGFRWYGMDGRKHIPRMTIQLPHRFHIYVYSFCKWQNRKQKQNKKRN